MRRIECILVEGVRMRAWPRRTYRVQLRLKLQGFISHKGRELSWEFVSL